MRDAELQPYVGRLVELRFVHGEEVIGRLVADPPVFPGNRYAMELPVSASREARTWRGIPDSTSVHSVRSLDGLP
jgi:hypothetical protein